MHQPLPRFPSQNVKRALVPGRQGYYSCAMQARCKLHANFASRGRASWVIKYSTRRITDKKRFRSKVIFPQVEVVWLARVQKKKAVHCNASSKSIASSIPCSQHHTAWNMIFGRLQLNVWPPDKHRETCFCELSLIYIHKYTGGQEVACEAFRRLCW